MNRAYEIVADQGSDQAAEPRPGVASWYAPGLTDGLGDRLLMFDNTGASSLELLRFKREFGHHPAFEAALRERIKQLEAFSHPQIAAVRSLDWLRAGEELALVSNHTPGRRLSEAMNEARGASFAIELIRQLSPVLALLERQGPGVAHGALTPERIVIGQDGKLVITEHVLGSAIESLHLPASRLRSDLGLAVSPTAGRVPLDGRTDILQLALIALSLLLGRRIEAVDHPSKTAALVGEFPWAGTEEAGATLRGWLERALQMGTGAFGSAGEASEALAEWREDRLLGQPPRVLQSIQTAPTTMSDFLDDFPSEAEGAVPARQAPRPDLALPAAPAPDFPAEFPSERPPAESAAAKPVPATKRAEAQAPSTAAQKAVAREIGNREALKKKEPPARLGWWVAVAFALAAAAEGGVLARLVYRGVSVKSLLTGTATLAPQSNESSKSNAESPKSDGTTPSSPSGGSPGVNAAAIGSGAPLAAGLAPLEVTSDPAGARVTIDGTFHGVTPITVPLAPGPHAVTISDGTTTTKRTVTSVAGMSSALMASFAAAPGTAAGWVAIHTPIELQVREGGALLGVTTMDRLMLPTGHHVLEIASAALGFTTTVPVEVQAGKTTPATVAVPNGSLSLNALPWANVTLDGQALAGTTPFANLEVPLGPHEIVWKHPQLGERRETVIVTLKAPVRRVLDWKAPIK